MNSNEIRQICFVVSWVCFVIWLAIMFFYYKAGKFTPPVKLRKWPIPVLVFFAMTIVFGGIALLLRPPITDEDGFGAVLTQLNSPKAHGLLLLSNPDPKANMVRTVERFESFSTSGKAENGYIQVKMLRDGAIGWLPKDIAKPDAQQAWKLWQRAVVAAIGDFCVVLFQWRSMVEILVGLSLAAILVALFGRKKAEFYSHKVDILAIVGAGIGALGTKIVLRELVPFSPGVALVEISCARACWMIRYAFPSILAALMANILFRKRQKSAAVLELIMGVTFIFLLYVVWGGLAAWWD